MQIDYYFDFTCPYAYLGSTQIEALARRHAVDFEWKPVLLGGLFQAVKTPMNLAAEQPEAKTQMLHRDLQRWAERYQVPLVVPDAHPMRSVRALRALLACPREQWSPLIDALFRAYWVEGKSFSSEATVAWALDEAGLSPSLRRHCLDANQDQARKDELRELSTAALEIGVFGVPGLRMHGDELDEPLFFWGQDRMSMVEAVIEGWRPALRHPYRPPSSLSSSSVAVAAAEPSEDRAIDFYFDFSSPFAYLASTQIEALAARCGARLRWKPILLGAVFKALGTENVPFLAMPDAKREYTSRELAMWASEWQVPFTFNQTFPLRTVSALRLVLQQEEPSALIHRLFRGAWVDSEDIGDAQTLESILGELELDAAALLEGCADPEVKAQLFENTRAALDAGVYGVPYFVAHREGQSEPYWGQDRLELLEAFFA